MDRQLKDKEEIIKLLKREIEASKKIQSEDNDNNTTVGNNVRIKTEESELTPCQVENKKRKVDY